MKWLSLVCLAALVTMLMAAPTFAFVQKNKDASGKDVEVSGPDHPVFSGAAIGAGLGAGLTIIGAGWGFGRIGAAALESMARQPETAGRIQTGMLIIAALLEGATFFSLIVCILANGKASF